MSDTNKAVTRSLDILDLLGRSDHNLRLKDIAFQLGLHESTTHRLLKSLATRGYVQQAGPNGAYSLGWKLVTLVGGMGSEMRLVQELRPYLRRLLSQVGFAINLGVLSEDHVMYLECLIPRQSVSLYVAPGTLFPLHATALGKALLAYTPPDEVHRILQELPFNAYTPNTITSVEKLQDELSQVRRRGYALDLAELNTEFICIAAPILDRQSRPIVAISLTGRASEITALPHWEERLPAAILETSREAGQIVDAWYSSQLPGVLEPALPEGNSSPSADRSPGEMEPV